MKSIILVIATIILCANTSAQIEFQPKAAFSYFIRDAHLFAQRGDDISYLYFGKYKTKVGGTLSYQNFGLEFDQQIFMKEFSFDRFFSPNVAKWDATIYYKYNNIKLSFTHTCIHPIKNRRQESMSGIYGGTRQISISYGY